jgi:DNA primase
MSTIDEVKSRIDIVDLVSESVQLRRSGKSYTGFCPFHPNSRTPAFVVWPESGTWRCFGQCAEGGDIFKFVMKKEGWDFAEALLPGG